MRVARAASGRRCGMVPAGAGAARGVTVRSARDRPSPAGRARRGRTDLRRRPARRRHARGARGAALGRRAAPRSSSSASRSSGDPALAREIVAAGHGVALHGHRHRNLLRVAPRALAADLDRAHDIIGEATGVAVSAYRPPYGIFSPAGLAIARRRRWLPLLWSRWGMDWRGSIDARPDRREVAGEAAAGDVAAAP